MKDERTTNVYTDAQIRKYQELVEESEIAQKKADECKMEVSQTTQKLEVYAKILKNPAKKFILIGWKMFWHGIFIMIKADPSSDNAQFYTNLLNDYWKAKGKIDEVRKVLKSQREEYAECNIRAQQSHRKVQAYLVIFPDIDTAKLSVDMEEETEEEES